MNYKTAFLLISLVGTVLFIGDVAAADASVSPPNATQAPTTQKITTKAQPPPATDGPSANPPGDSVPSPDDNSGGPPPGESADSASPPADESATAQASGITSFYAIATTAVMAAAAVF